MRTIILNVGVGSWHPRGTKRLQKSLFDTGFAGNIQCWTEGYPEGSKSHQQVPYQFKPCAFQWAKENGYDLALWLDSSVCAKKPVNQLFDQIKTDGHLMLQNGYTSGQWCCDSALQPLNVSRDEIMQMPHLIAGIMGLDLNNERSLEFLKQWTEVSDEAFTGEWTNTGICSEDKRVLGHRHDQTAASVISIRLGMKWTFPQGIFDYNINADSILVAQGM